jgi:hypothetical protein
MNMLQPDSPELSRSMQRPVSGVPGMSLELALEKVNAAYEPEPEIVASEPAADARVTLTAEGEVEDRAKRERIAEAQREVDAAYLEAPQTTAAQFDANLLME